MQEQITNNSWTIRTNKYADFSSISSANMKLGLEGTDGIQDVECRRQENSSEQITNGC